MLTKAHTGSGRSEVHALSQASGFHEWIVHTATALELVDEGKWQFLLSPQLDLYCIKKQDTGSQHTEVHILTKQSDYQQFVLHAAVPLPQLNAYWAFAMRTGMTWD
jgi:hypothetical protein